LVSRCYGDLPRAFVNKMKSGNNQRGTFRFRLGEWEGNSCRMDDISVKNIFDTQTKSVMAGRHIFSLATVNCNASAPDVPMWRCSVVIFVDNNIIYDRMTIVGFGGGQFPGTQHGDTAIQYTTTVWYIIFIIITARIFVGLPLATLFRRISLCGSVSTILWPTRFVLFVLGSRTSRSSRFGCTAAVVPSTRSSTQYACVTATVRIFFLF